MGLILVVALMAVMGFLRVLLIIMALAAVEALETQAVAVLFVPEHQVDQVAAVTLQEGLVQLELQAKEAMAETLLMPTL